MIRVRTALKTLAACYLIFGVLWAFTLGIQTLTLRQDSSEQEHYDNVLSVTSAHLVQDGNLVICVAGLREQRGDKGTTPPVPFSLIIPVTELWNKPASAKAKGFISADMGEDQLVIPRESTKDGCTSDATAQRVPVVAIPPTTPSDFFDGLGTPEREKLTPPGGSEHAVFVVPVSSDGATFDRSREIDYVAARPNVLGKHAYRIRVMPVRKRGSVPLWKWPVAIAIDMLTWPFEIVLWMGFRS